MKVAETFIEANPPGVLREARLRVPEIFKGTIYAAVLFWLNAYICREMFVRYTPHMNSMQGFWIAMARSPSASVRRAERESNWSSAP